MKAALMFLILATGAAARAETIEFPAEELATESVLPVFDQPMSVKNRSVVTEKRMEIGALGGYSLTEAFFNPYGLGISAGYHFTESHGLNLLGLYWLSGTTSYTKQLNPPPGSTQSLNLQYAPGPKYLMLPSYQYTGFYGKFSLTKDYVMNLSLYGTAGLGVIAIGDATKPVMSFGLGQKFYFGPSFALRFDLRILVYRGPNILDNENLKNAREVQPASSFPDTTILSTLLTVGGIYLIPNS